MKTISAVFVLLVACFVGSEWLQVVAESSPVDASPGVVAITKAKEDILADRRVMILGDSITQQGTYVNYLKYFLTRTYPDKSFDFINVGLSSETASGLSENGHAGGAFPRPCVHERLQRALDAVKPKVVVACYGMNDGIYQPYCETNMKAFVDGMTKLVTACKVSGSGVILLTPPIFEGGDYDLVLGKFAEWEVAHPPSGVLAVVDLHTAMAAAQTERRKTVPGFKFSSDNVHPGEVGHIVMARAILKGLGISTPAGIAEELLKAAHADPLFNLVCEHCSKRADGWRNYVGYTRERTVAPGTGNIEAVEATARESQSKIEAMKN